ncbi:MAG: CdaR family protein [bacterium]
MLKYLTNNWQLKLLALVLALFLWMYVVNGGYKIDFIDAEIPISVHNLDTGLSLRDDLGSVTLQVRAPLSTWENLDENSFTAFIDAKDLTLGEYTAAINVLVADSTVQVLSKKPERLTFAIENTTTKEVEVTARGLNDLGNGYEIKEFQSTPDKVTISGSTTNINKTAKVVAEVDLTGQMADFSAQAKLLAVDEAGNKLGNVTVTPATADVQILVQRETDTKIVGVEPITTGSPAAGYWIKEVQLNPSTVTVRGDETRLAELTSVQTNSLDINGLNSDSEISYSLNIPEGLEVVNFEGGTMKIILGQTEINKTLSLIPEVTSLKNDLKIASLDPETVSVNIKGMSGTLETLTSSDVLVQVRGDNIGAPGTYTLPLDTNNVTILKDAEVLSLNAKNLRVVVVNK